MSGDNKPEKSIISVVLVVVALCIGFCISQVMDRNSNNPIDVNLGSKIISYENAFYDRIAFFYESGDWTQLKKEVESYQNSEKGDLVSEVFVRPNSNIDRAIKHGTDEIYYDEFCTRVKNSHNCLYTIPNMQDHDSEYAIGGEYLDLNKEEFLHILNYDNVDNNAKMISVGMSVSKSKTIGKVQAYIVRNYKNGETDLSRVVSKRVNKSYKDVDYFLSASFSDFTNSNRIKDLESISIAITGLGEDPIIESFITFNDIDLAKLETDSGVTVYINSSEKVSTIKAMSKNSELGICSIVYLKENIGINSAYLTDNADYMIGKTNKSNSSSQANKEANRLNLLGQKELTDTGRLINFSPSDNNCSDKNEIDKIIKDW